MDVLEQFITKKEADSDFVKLEDGDTLTVKQLLGIESVTTTGYNGEPKDTLRFKVLVDTMYGEKTKNFDNSSMKFAAEFRKKGVKIGGSFKLTRHGTQQKTVYFISDVKEPAPKAAAPANEQAAKPVADQFVPPAADNAGSANA